ncbi:hypothetical protein B0H14DRAFT_2588237 [Mycena olivaceomarginata]|nr:hypothetical protein B0H14DRAFT_2588237 [Mycena olivaceomarginata]
MRKLKWMYNPDPFATRKEVEQCQAQALNKRRDQFAPLESTEVNPRGTQPRPTAASGEFADAPEVKMAGALRELAEDAIKQMALAKFGENVGGGLDLGTSELKVYKIFQNKSPTDIYPSTPHTCELTRFPAVTIAFTTIFQDVSLVMKLNQDFASCCLEITPTDVFPEA